MGVQTGSEESRHNYFERYDTNNEIVNAANIIHKHKIRCTYDLIMDNPLEDDRNKRETFELLLRLPRPFVLCIHSLTHFPGTKLTQLLLEKELISLDDVEDQKEKSYSRWIPTLDLERNKEDQFWDDLYCLNQNRFIPRWLLVWLSHRDLLKKHPTPLTYLLRLTSCSIYTIRNDSPFDKVRWLVLTAIHKPYLVFKRRTWYYLWSKTKQKISLPADFEVSEQKIESQ